MEEAKFNKEINLNEVRALAQRFCTLEEIARTVGYSRSGLRARARKDPELQEAIDSGQSSAKVSLRRKQMEIAMNDKHSKQTTMLIFLGKNYLGQSDKLEHKVRSSEKDINDGDFKPEELTNEELDDVLRGLTLIEGGSGIDKGKGQAGKGKAKPA